MAVEEGRIDIDSDLEPIGAVVVRERPDGDAVLDRHRAVGRFSGRLSRCIARRSHVARTL
jgi:hypothetical protein